MDLPALLVASGIDFAALGLAAARATPTVLIVPTFGLRGLPLQARLAVGVALVVSVAPALGGAASADALGGAWAAALLLEALHGLPVAVATAAPLWAATMAGGLFAGATSGAYAREAEVPFGTALGLLASAVFLSTGGPSRVVDALFFRATPDHPLLDAIRAMTGGIALAVALAAPLIVVALVLDAATALLARAAAPVRLGSVTAPLRTLAMLVVTGVVLERVARALEIAFART